MLVGNIETALLLLLLLIIIIIIMVLLLLLFYTKMCSSLNVLVNGQKEFKMLYNFLVREHIFSKTDIDTTSLNPFNIFLYIRRRGKEREMAKEATEGQVTRKREKKKTEEATEQLKEREEATEGQVTRKREKATEQLKESEEETEGQVTREREKKKETEEATKGQMAKVRETEHRDRQRSRHR